MAWVAIDRTVQGIKKHGLPGDADHWQALAEVIRADILEKGVDPDRNCFTQYYGSKAMDASLLMIPQVGFLPMDDDRIINTIHAVEEDLSDNGFILRYKAEATDDGLKGSEGTFIMCSFWMVECLAMIGEVQKAQMLFDRLLDIRNDVGLLSEEYDTVHHRMLGNMPQAFSHVGAHQCCTRIAGRRFTRRGVAISTTNGVDHLVCFMFDPWLSSANSHHSRSSTRSI